jgi:membrane protein
VKRIKGAFSLLKQAGTAMSQDQATTMAAALAYYTVFSIAPLLVIAVGLVGLVFGPEASVKVFSTIDSLVGPQGAQAVQALVKASQNKPHAGLIAAVVGFVTLIVGASGVFQQLLTSLDIIWKVTPHPKASWKVFLRQRLISFGMIAVIGFLLLVSLIVTTALAAVGGWAAATLPGGKILLQLVNSLITVVAVGALFSALFKVLPDVKLSWRDVWVGGVITAVLFEGGKYVIGAYIGKAATASAYGAAGSLIVVLLWVYYSSQILLFGAELTRARVLRTGKKIEPKKGSVYAHPGLTQTTGGS